MIAACQVFTIWRRSSSLTVAMIGLSCPIAIIVSSSTSVVYLIIFLQSDQDGHNLCDSGTAPLQRCLSASPQLDNLACPSSYTCSCRTHSDMKRYWSSVCNACGTTHSG